MPKTIAPMMRPGSVSLTKNALMPMAKPTFSVIRRAKKFIRSKSFPQTGLISSRATFGITTVNQAIWTGVGWNSRPYLSGFAKYSIRSGSIIRLAKPISIQEIRVRRNSGSSATCRSGRSGCDPRSLSEARDGH